MTVKGIVEAQTRVRNVFGPHEGHELSFGRIMMGDKEDAKSFAYVGCTCETCRMLVDATLAPTSIADALDEMLHGNLK